MASTVNFVASQEAPPLDGTSKLGSFLEASHSSSTIESPPGSMVHSSSNLPSFRITCDICMENFDNMAHVPRYFYVFFLLYYCFILIVSFLTVFTQFVLCVLKPSYSKQSKTTTLVHFVLPVATLSHLEQPLPPCYDQILLFAEY